MLFQPQDIMYNHISMNKQDLTKEEKIFLEKIFNKTMNQYKETILKLQSA